MSYSRRMESAKFTYIRLHMLFMIFILVKFSYFPVVLCTNSNLKDDFCMRVATLLKVIREHLAYTVKFSCFKILLM
jgi:hypothetical protein